MSLKSRTFECPVADLDGELHTFTVLMDDSDPPPDRCEVCGEWVGEPIQLPSMFKRKSSQTSVIDYVQRQYSDISIRNAEATASQLGLPNAAVSHMKVTDMNTNLREGDVAAKSRYVPPPATAFNTNFQQGLGMAQREMGRPGAGAGFAAVEGLRANHGRTWAGALANGRMREKR